MAFACVSNTGQILEESRLMLCFVLILSRCWLKAGVVSSEKTSSRAPSENLNGTHHGSADFISLLRGRRHPAVMPRIAGEKNYRCELIVPAGALITCRIPVPPNDNNA